MRKARLIILLLSLLVTIVSCKRSQMPAIQRALSVYASEPDSALAILNGMERKSLPASEEAMYALIYTASQDKSGLDVSSDSLIRIAYDHYAQLPKDSLYSRCMYYMGKYYWLNDSLDRAEYCLKKAERRAAMDCDTATQCLALEKLQRTVRHRAPNRGLAYINKAINLYKHYSKASVRNTIYLLLDKCLSEWFLNRTAEALAHSNEILKMALELNDSAVISDVYQDMACFSGDVGHTQIALEQAKLSCKFAAKYDLNKMIELAYAYEMADSLNSCLNLLDTLTVITPSYYYDKSHLRFLIAIKKRDYLNAKLYSDSSCHYIRTMYKDELRTNAENYNKLMVEKVENTKNENKVVALKYIVTLIILLAISVVLLILLSYKNYKAASSKKLADEKERIKYEQILHKKEVEQAEKLHQEEIKHKNIQMETMRKFLMQKIDIISRLNENSENHVVISDAEWNEMEVYLESVDNLFVSRLRKQFNNLTTDDIRLLMLLRLKVATKILANIYGISEKSIRQKLFVFKGKLDLTEKGLSLRQFINNF